jgi:hypothetical protein
MTDSPDSSITFGLLSSPREGLIERLRARADAYAQVVVECRAELAQADAENAAQGHITTFVNDPCPTCDDSATLIPLLREAALSLQSATARAEQAEQERDALRETNSRLNRRSQSAEAALNERTEDWNKRSTDKQRNHYFTRYREAEQEAGRLRTEAQALVTKWRQVVALPAFDDYQHGSRAAHHECANELAALLRGPGDTNQ